MDMSCYAFLAQVSLNLVHFFIVLFPRSIASGALPIQMLYVVALCLSFLHQEPCRCKCFVLLHCVQVFCIGSPLEQTLSGLCLDLLQLHRAICMRRFSITRQTC